MPDEPSVVHGMPDNADVFVPGAVIPALVTRQPGPAEQPWRTGIRTREMVPLGPVVIRMRDQEPPTYWNALVGMTAGVICGDGVIRWSATANSMEPATQDGPR